MRTTVLNHCHTFHPESQAEYDRLVVEEKRLTRAIARRGDIDAEEPTQRRRMSEPPEDLEAELAAVRAQMDEQRKVIASGWVRLVVKGLPRKEFRRILTEHPPRDDNALDQQLGYNADTFGEALIAACTDKTLAHELCGGEAVPNEWDTWADEMTDGQYGDIFTACLKLNTDGQPTFPR